MVVSTNWGTKIKIFPQYVAFYMTRGQNIDIFVVEKQDRKDIGKYEEQLSILSPD